jgi:hypothetical protein
MRSTFPDLDLSTVEAFSLLVSKVRCFGHIKLNAGDAARSAGMNSESRPRGGQKQETLEEAA